MIFVDTILYSQRVLTLSFFQLVVEANQATDQIFLLLAGKVSLEVPQEIGPPTFLCQICFDDEVFFLLFLFLLKTKKNEDKKCLTECFQWPIFCERTALSATGISKIPFQVIAQQCGCRVQGIPTKKLYSSLFSNLFSLSSVKSAEKQETVPLGVEPPQEPMVSFEEKDFSLAVLFYETMCRHYASKLNSLHSQFDEKEEKKGENRIDCLRIHGEPVVYHWDYFCLDDQSEEPTLHLLCLR